MTINEYLKVALRHKFLIIFVILLAFVGGYFAHTLTTKYQFNNTIFYIIGTQDTTGKTDSFENLQAADQITESILGWFKDPSFQASVNERSELSFGLKSKKQEKNNLVITFFSDNEENSRKYAEAVNKTLLSYMENYNNNSTLRITLTGNALNIAEKNSDLSLYLIVSLILGLIFGYLGAFSYEYLFKKLQSTSELKQILGKDPLFQFRSHKDLKLNYHFLVKILENQFGKENLQILDLTSKSKTGIEVISRHGNFQNIKSIDLPGNVEQISPNAPTLIISELGKSNLNTLSQINSLGLKNFTSIVLDSL